jgi:hypothetical protein
LLEAWSSFEEYLERFVMLMKLLLSVSIGCEGGFMGCVYVVWVKREVFVRSFATNLVFLGFVTV